MADPPSEAGAVQVTMADPTPAVAEPMVGAPAVVGVVTELDWAEAAPVPTPLMAATVNV